MRTVLIPIASVLAYLALTMVAACWRYRAIRPYTEPLACENRALCERTWHSDSCYRRSGLIDTKTEAVMFALLTGLVWPFILPAIALGRLVVAGDRELPEETRAQIERLEAENEQLRLQQEGNRP
jgi:hypothetical protein